MPASVQHCKNILKVLRKREAKTLTQIAGEVGEPVKALSTSIGHLVDTGQAVRHHHRPSTYTKA